jgi:hypothetical protein
MKCSVFPLLIFLATQLHPLQVCTVTATLSVVPFAHAQASMTVQVIPSEGLIYRLRLCGRICHFYIPLLVGGGELSYFG